MTDTTMRAAMEKAGLLTPQVRLRKIIEDVSLPRAPDAVMRALVASKDVEAALALFDPEIVAARLRGTIKQLERDRGQFSATGNGQEDSTPTRSTGPRPGGGQAAFAHGHVTNTPAGSRPVWTPDDIAKSGDAGGPATRGGHQQGTRHAPGHAKQRSPEALKAVSEVVAKSRFDIETIRGRPVGDILYGEMERSARISLTDGIEHVRKAALQNALYQSVPYNPALRDVPARNWADDKVFERFDARWEQLVSLGLEIPKIAELFGLERPAA